MKKSIAIALTDEELIELARILQDEDEREALGFLKKHVKGRLREALESTGKCRSWLDMQQ